MPVPGPTNTKDLVKSDGRWKFGALQQRNNRKSDKLLRKIAKKH